MKPTVQNVELILGLQPLQVAKYLQANGWHEESKIDDKASIWILKNNLEQEFEILLPLKPEFRDFPLRIYEVVQTLEIVEHRSQFEIIGDLITSAANIQVQGVVTKLDEEAETGKVTMVGCAVGKLRKINVELNEPEYNLAIKAYHERLPVVCTGDLIKEDSSFVLKDPHNFALYPDA